VAYPELHDKMTFSAILPDGREEKFSLAEYLAWREFLGMRVPENEVGDWVKWMNADDNNYGRMSCWLSVQQLRTAYPNNTAVARFRLSGEWVNGTR